MRRALTRLALAVGALLGAVALLGCGALAADEETLIPLDAEDAPTSSATGVVSIAPSDRGEPVVMFGVDLSGDAIDLATRRGRITVVNFWATWCAPCREEIPEIVEAARAVPEVAFIGVNVADDPDAASTLGATLPYPSIVDIDGALLAKTPNVPPKALPITLILDTQGRVAVRIIGPIPRGSLRPLIDSLR